MRARPDEYAALDLCAHRLLEDVPLHDVWSVDLPGGDGWHPTVADVHALFSTAGSRVASGPARALFALRRWLGARLGWDRQPADASTASLLHRLSAEQRESSLVPPGTPQGPFRVLTVSRRESISEIHNATVHAFSAMALVDRGRDYRLYWAVYVLPVGRFTRWYMRLIDPFRRRVIYPALLRQIRRAWVRRRSDALS